MACARNQWNEALWSMSLHSYEVSLPNNGTYKTGLAKRTTIQFKGTKIIYFMCTKVHFELF